MSSSTSGSGGASTLGNTGDNGPSSGGLPGSSSAMQNGSGNYSFNMGSGSAGQSSDGLGVNSAVQNASDPSVSFQMPNTQGSTNGNLAPISGLSSSMNGNIGNWGVSNGVVGTTDPSTANTNYMAAAQKMLAGVGAQMQTQSQAPAPGSTGGSHIRTQAQHFQAPVSSANVVSGSKSGQSIIALLQNMRPGQNS